MRISSKAIKKCKKYLLLVSLHQEHPREHSTLSCFPRVLARGIHLPLNSPDTQGSSGGNCLWLSCFSLHYLYRSLGQAGVLWWKAQARCQAESREAFASDLPPAVFLVGFQTHDARQPRPAFTGMKRLDSITADRPGYGTDKNVFQISCARHRPSSGVWFLSPPHMLTIPVSMPRISSPWLLKGMCVWGSLSLFSLSLSLSFWGSGGVLHTIQVWLCSWRPDDNLSI